MPIYETDPWLMQYLDGIVCPDEVNMPAEDGDAWR